MQLLPWVLSVFLSSLKLLTLPKIVLEIEKIAYMPLLRGMYKSRVQSGAVGSVSCHSSALRLLVL